MIASFLGSTSLRVSEVSHALLGSYGSTLTSMPLHYVEESRAGQPTHNSIAAFLGSTSRRVSEISHALFESYGSILTSMHLRYVADNRAGPLGALLRRNIKIKYVMVRRLQSLPALCQAIKHGLCRGVERLSLRARRPAFTKERLSLLAGAFENGRGIASPQAFGYLRSAYSWRAVCPDEDAGGGHGSLTSGVNLADQSRRQ